MIFKLIRWPLGQLILAGDYLTSPKRPNRPAKLQQAIDARVAGMALYQFRTCPFCVKTRRALKRLGLDIELRDAKNDPHWRGQLEREGGRLQVPCLYIPGDDGEARWLYESDDIIRFLTEQVEAVEAPAAI
jgi:glutaredoxin